MQRLIGSEIRRGACLLVLSALALTPTVRARDNADLASRRSDRLAQLNEVALAIPEEQRAWPLYREALLALKSDPDFNLREDLSRKSLPADENWGEIGAYLERQNKAIALLREAASRDSLGYVMTFEITEADQELVGRQDPPDADTSTLWLLDLPLFQILPLRTAAEVLRADFLVAVEENDTSRAIADLEALVGTARHARQPAMTISQLISAANTSMALRVLQQCAVESPELFSVQELERLGSLLAGVASSSMFTQDTAIEEQMFEDAIEQSFAQRGKNKGRITRRGFRRWDEIAGFVVGFLEDDPDRDDVLGADKRKALREAVATAEEQRAMYKRLLAIYQDWADLPPWERGECSADKLVEEFSTGSYISQVKYLPVAVVNPTSTMVRGTLGMDLVARHLDAMRTLIAIEQFRRKSGHYPNKLAELVPELLPEIPTDYFDGEPLRYMKTDEGYLLYSIGVDRDDDGGREPEEGDPSHWIAPEAMGHRDVADGDWILVNTRH